MAWEAGPKGKGVNFLPSAQLQTPFIVFQGEIDQVCDPPGTARFIQQTSNAQIVNLPNVGHGYSVQKNWMPQFKQSFQQLTSAATEVRAPAQLGDLPLIEAPVSSNSDTFAVILTGDGGWASLDRELAGAITAKGFPVVGWDSLHYYWTPRTPEDAASDLGRIVRHYAQAWHKNKVMLIGFSRGADVLPFLVNKLAASEKERVSQVVLLGLSNHVDLELKVTDWLPGGGEGSLDVIAESNKLRGLHALCIYGAGEKDSGCRKLDRKYVAVTELAGGHHFGGNYAEVAEVILRHQEKTP